MSRAIGLERTLTYAAPEANILAWREQFNPLAGVVQAMRPPPRNAEIARIRDMKRDEKL